MPAAAAGRTSLSDVPAAHRHGAPWSAASNGIEAEPLVHGRVEHEPAAPQQPRLLALAHGPQVHQPRAPAAGVDPAAAPRRPAMSRGRPGARPGPDAPANRGAAGARPGPAARTPGSCGGSRSPDRASPPRRPGCRQRPRGPPVRRRALDRVWSTPMWTTLARSGSSSSSASASSRAWAEKNMTRSATASAAPGELPVPLPRGERVEVRRVAVADHVLVGDHQAVARAGPAGPGPRGSRSVTGGGRCRPASPPQRPPR